MQVLPRANILFTLFLAAAVLLAGCSSSKDRSSPSTMLVHVQAAQGDIENAYVRAGVIQNNGVLEYEGDGRTKVIKVQTNKHGLASMQIMRTQMHQFNLVNREANKARNQESSYARCQWVQGCQQDGQTVAFGEQVDLPINWVTTTWGLSEKETVYVTPLTTLASELADKWVYNETNKNDKKWYPSTYYSPQSIIQANSQISKLFGLRDIVSLAPADLTQLKKLSLKETPIAVDSIRYGALVAAWLHLVEQDENFAENAVAEITQNRAADTAQILEKDESEAQSFTLDKIYRTALENLEKIEAKGKLKNVIGEAISSLNRDLNNLFDGVYSEVWPDSLTAVLGEDSYSDYSLGLLQTKAFVSELNGMSEQFFNESYQEKLNTYQSDIQNLINKNRDSYHQLITTLIKAEEDYRQSCPQAQKNCSKMIGNVKYTLSPDSKNNNYLELHWAGTYQQGDLRLSIKDKKDSKGSVTERSYLRVYFGVDNKVSDLITSNQLGNAEPLAYELRWADFTLFDSVENKAEQTGQLHTFYRGVDGNNGIHFNIEKYELNSKLSDAINDNGELDKDVATLYLGVQSTNAHTYYAAEEFAAPSLDNFFESSVGAPSVGNIEANLVRYEFGTEELSKQEVEYLDIYITDGDSTRYRFYPTVVREDTLDINGNGDFTEKIKTHDMSICSIDNNGQVLGTCSPKQRFYEERDIQRTLNTLWKAGAFSYITVSGKGEYFVEWPAEKNNGCYDLKELEPAGASFDGQVISSEVLGLNNLRLTSEILLKEINSSGEEIELPKTMMDLKMYKPTQDRVELTYALSNNYTGVSSDQVFLGTGANMNRIIFNYNTNSAFARTGNISFYKGGVSITPEGALSSAKINGELFFGFSQAYESLPHKYVIGPEGDEVVCVTENEPLKRGTLFAEDMEYSLAFGGVVYGTIRNNGSNWKAYFVDGTEQNMDGFEKFFEMVTDFRVYGQS